MSSPPSVRTRIAPSPTGQLHIGSLAIALRNFAYAKGRGGQFIIRIEDTDRERFVPGATEETLKVLKDYGLNWDEGPDIDGPYGPYIQSQRLERYQERAQWLVDQGHAYYCICSKEELKEMRDQQLKRKEIPKYDRRCLKNQDEVKKKIAAGNKYIIRMKIPFDENHPPEPVVFNDLVRGEISISTDNIDDQVLLKSDGFPTYHLAVVVDDHDMRITHIIRGEEWISSTPKHIWLYQKFGWDQSEVMPQYAHVPVFLSPTGKGKMSKRHGDVSARSFLEQGYLPEAMLNFLMIMGWAPKDKNEVMNLQRFQQEFDIRDISSKAVIFDTNKLNWLNGLYIRTLTADELFDRLQPYKPPELSDDLLKRFIPLIKDRLETLSQIGEFTQYFYQQPELDPKAILKESKITPQETAAYLHQVETVISQISDSDWSVATLETKLHDLQQQLGFKPRPAFMTIRLAVTGRSATPPLFDVLHLLGRDRCLTNLSHAQKILQA